MLGHRATSEALIYQKVSAMKPNRLFVSLVTISILISSFLASPASAKAPVVTWKISWLEQSRSYATSSLVSTKSTGKKVWSASGSCALNNGKLRTKSSGVCTIKLALSAKGKFTAKTFSIKLPISLLVARPVLEDAVYCPVAKEFVKAFEHARPNGSDWMGNLVSNSELTANVEAEFSRLLRATQSMVDVAPIEIYLMAMEIGNYVESYYKLLEKYSFQTQDMIHFASDQELKYLSNFDSNKYYDDEAEDVFLFSPWFERRIIQHCKKYGESWWWQS